MINFSTGQKAAKKKHVYKRREKKTREVKYEKIIGAFTKLKPKYLNLGLLLAVLAMGAFGVAMVFSASWYNANFYFGDKYHYFTKQLIGFILGIVLMAGMYFIDYHIFLRLRWVCLIVAVVLLLLVFVPGIGISRLGANRWIGIGGFSMQPSEIAKFAFIIFASAVAGGTQALKHAKPDEKNLGGRPQPLQKLSFKKVFLILGVGGGICSLILLEPNLSITLCLGMTMLIMLFLCGAKLKHLALIMVPVLVLFPLLLIAEPYRIKRLVAFVDPWATPKAEGFQLIQSLYSLGNGGLFGRGFGNSTQKYMFLPFAESDFIFSIIGEEFGLVGCILFMAVLAFMIFQIFRVGTRCRDNFGRFLCFGIGTLIFVQSAINLAVVTGSIPPTGLPLPFISFGGTSLAVYLAAIGIVLNIDKQNKKRAKVID